MKKHLLKLLLIGFVSITANAQIINPPQSATTIPVQSSTPNVTAFPVWVTANTGALIPYTTTSGQFYFNPSAGSINAAVFNGPLVGNVTGNVSGSAGSVTTNANLTGPITSVGNATSIASQTGTGTKFVVDNSPTIITPTFSGTAVGSISGNAATVTTNANLTGPITSVGNATSIASQTGTGTKFVVDNSPTLITPVLGVASATSVNFGGGALNAYVPATSWTPTDLSGASLTFTNVSANYTRIGNLIFAYFSLTFPSTGSNTASIIGGLPVAVPNQSYAEQGAVAKVNTGSIMMAHAIKNSSTLGFTLAAGTDVTNLQLSGATITVLIIYPVQ